MPRAPLRFLSILLLVAALLLVGAGLHMTWSTLSTTQVADTGRYMGALKPLNPPARVVLPAGIPLQTILVANGETVRRGETVALVDTSELSAAVDEARFRLEADRALLRCLGTLARPDGQVEIPAAPLHAPQPFRLLSALRQCEEAVAALAQINEDHDQKADQIRARLAIEAQRKSLLVQSARNPARPIGEREALTRAAVVADTNRADLSLALDHIETSRRAALASERLAIAEAFSSLGESVRVAETQLRLMERFLETPRLQAPADGIARKVRAETGLAAPVENTPILRVEAPDPQVYAVHFPLDEQRALKIPLGSEVRILPMGAALGRLPLTGEITGFLPVAPEDAELPAKAQAGGAPVAPDQPARVEAQIALSADSVSRMADRYRGLAFAGEGSASQITVELAPVPLADLVEGSLMRLGWPPALPRLAF